MPLQFRPRYTRAHTVKARPSASSTMPSANSSGPGGSRRSESQSHGTRGHTISATPMSSGTTCDRREPSDSRRCVFLAPNAETTQYRTQANHNPSISWR